MCVPSVTLLGDVETLRGRAGREVTQRPSLFLLHSLPLISHKGKSCLPKLLYDILPCHMSKAVDEGLTNSALEISATVSKTNIFFFLCVS